MYAPRLCGRARHDHRDAGTRTSVVYNAFPLCSLKYFKARYGCTAPSTAVSLSADISASTASHAASSASVAGRPAYAATTEEITLLVTASLLADVVPAVLAHTSTNRRSSNRTCDSSASLRVAPRGWAKAIRHTSTDAKHGQPDARTVSAVSRPARPLCEL